MIEDFPEGHVLGDDCFTPSQWFDLRRGGDDPIQNLLLAVLEVALRDATGVNPRSRRKRRPIQARWRAQHSRKAQDRAADATDWIFDDEADGVMAFRSICSACEIDPDALRERIRGRRAA